MSLKSTFAGVAAAALVVAAPATALAANPGHGHGGTHGNHGKSHSHFTANGKVTAVDDAGFTMHVKGGSKDLHGTDVTVALSDNAKVRRNGAKAALADLQVGDKVNAVGARAEDGSLTARHVNAHGPDADDSTDATDGTDDSATDGTDDSGADTSGTDTSGTDTSGTDTSGTDTSGSDTSGTGTGV